MSKSLGNFFTVRDLLDQGIPGEVIRFVLLSTHYRQPMDLTERKAEEARATLERWCERCRAAARRRGRRVRCAVADVIGGSRTTSTRRGAIC